MSEIKIKLLRTARHYDDYDRDITDRYVTPQELVEDSCLAATNNTRGEIETLREEHSHMIHLIGGVIERLMAKKVLDVSDLQEVFYDLDGWEITAE